MNVGEWIIVALLCLMLAVGAVVVIVTARAAAMELCPAPDTGWEPPDLRLCPKDMALWDCIRNASYRSDI